MRIMAGTDKDFTGEAFAAEGAKVGYLPQEPQLDPSKNVRQNVMLGVAEKQALLDRYNELAANYSDETADEMAKLQDEIEAKGLWDLDAQVDLAMDALRCPDDNADVNNLSGGEKRRVALCQLLLSEPDILLLDEPTNHLDAETVGWLEQYLRNYKGAVLIVTHDRYFLDNVTGWILELDRGRGIPYEGNYSSWLVQKQKRLEQEGREEEARQRAIEREREWIQSSPKARQAKNKARFQRYDELVAKQNDKAPQTAQIIIPVAERLGQNVIDAEGLSKGFGDQLLIENLNFKLPPGGIVGVIGPNGAGKTTLFRMITGQEKPDSGTIKIGESVKLGYVDQSRDSLDGNKNVWEEISAATRSSSSAHARCIAGPMYRPSTSRAATSRRRSVRSRAASVIACILRRCSARTRMCCCLTSRPTTSTWIRCARSKRRSRISRAARLSSATTASFSTGSQPICLLRRRQPCRMVRRQFPGLRSGQETPSRRSGGNSASDQVQEVRALKEPGVVRSSCLRHALRTRGIQQLQHRLAVTGFRASLLLAKLARNGSKLYFPLGGAVSAKLGRVLCFS